MSKSLILSQTQIIFEMKKIKSAFLEKNSRLMKLYYDENLQRLSVPKKDVHKGGFITLSSKTISYHLLATYLLLDVIDYLWDGTQFFMKELPSDFFLIKELTVKEFTNPGGFPEAIEACRALYSLAEYTQLYIFLLPYKYHRDYVLNMAYPGHTLLLYDNGKPISETLYEGVAEFYIKTKLQGKLPRWAKKYSVYLDEFSAWAKGKPSLFKPVD